MAEGGEEEDGEEEEEEDGDCAAKRTTKRGKEWRDRTRYRRDCVFIKQILRRIEGRVVNKVKKIFFALKLQII